MWIEPVIDRTQSDVINKTPKGFINDIDLNRIEINSKYLAEQLNKYGYKVMIFTKIDWDMIKFPSTTEINRIRDNVNVLLEAYFKMPGSPDIKYWNYLNWQDANSLEQNLLNINILLGLMVQSFKYCGDFACGEDVI